MREVKRYVFLRVDLVAYVECVIRLLLYYNKLTVDFTKGFFNECT